MTRTELLNLLIKSNGLQSYLEIGMKKSENNFDKIIARQKVSVDPDYKAGAMWKFDSDDFFWWLSERNNQNMSEVLASYGHRPGLDNVIDKITDDWEKNNSKTPSSFDIIFIDGDHNSEQVEKDIINSMRVLNPGGFIVLHDCNPEYEWQQLVPRQHKVWYGDVWRAFVGFRIKYPEVDAFLLDHDCGLGIIRYTDKQIEPGFITDMPWQEFDQNRKSLLGII